MRWGEGFPHGKCIPKTFVFVTLPASNIHNSAQNVCPFNVIGPRISSWDQSHTANYFQLLVSVKGFEIRQFSTLRFSSVLQDFLESFHAIHVTASLVSILGNTAVVKELVSSYAASSPALRMAAYFTWD